jgi:anti-anti-sigma factor
MNILLPPMVGMQSHPNLTAKVDKALANRDMAIDLDCRDTSFSTSNFMRFIVRVHKKVRGAGGTLRLLNADDSLYEGLVTSGLADAIEITRRSLPGKRKVHHGRAK